MDMTPVFSLVVYCVLILLASLGGGWIPMLLQLTHKRLELAVSFVAGVMLGVGLLHMLPHALMARLEVRALQSGEPDLHHALAHAVMGPILLWLLAGFLLMFFIERFFCFHHHDAPAAELNAVKVAGVNHNDEHEHAALSQHHAAHPGRHQLTWTGAAIGLGVHSLIEGVALAASIEIARHAHDDRTALAGLGTFLVIFLHKPFDSLSLGTLMGLAKRSVPARQIVNGAFSLLVPLGVALFYLGATRGEESHDVTSFALAFSAGTFLCIAMSDLLPELQFHQHDRVKLSAALLAGLALAWMLSVLESQVHGS
jgi:zinc and cadmium transporter